MNSGADLWRQFGILAHVGQPEAQAGREAGERMAAAGVRNAICINHTLENKALGSAARRSRRRCARPAVERTRSCSTSRTATSRRRSSPPRSIASRRTACSASAPAARRRRSTPRSSAVRAARVKIGTFDLTPEVLEAIKDGRILFAVDQQAYLQGYMPIVMLTQEARYGLFPSRGQVVATGPNFVTRETASLALQLSSRGIR
jgi:simple sugar transport system substrate-binding protein